MHKASRSHLVHRQKARKLVKQYQIPFVLALRVATRDMSLVDALRAHEDERALELLQESHTLSKGEAMMVHSGETELEALLVNKRRKEHLDEHADKSVFTEQTELRIWTHGNQIVSQKIVGVEQYDFTLGNGQKLPKLHIKAVAFSDYDYTIVEERSQPSEPIVRIENRFRISNKQLFAFHEAQVNLTVELLEGLVFTGKLKTIRKFELELVNEKEDSLHLLRHALFSITAE
jgi:hypothetical protein